LWISRIQALEHGVPREFTPVFAKQSKSFSLIDSLAIHRDYTDRRFLCIAVSRDDMEMFGVLDLETSFEGCHFAIGVRNANNKRFRLACGGELEW
jgi:hypothetical protein